MNNYRQMAVRYLKLNKKRSMVTVIGVTVAVTVLYTMLNLGWCWLLQERKTLREQQDYEIVFFTENTEQAAQVMADARVKSAYMGPYYKYDYQEPIMYENALYINTTNPYRMETTLQEMADTYGVEGRLNALLAETYMQGGDANGTFVMVIFTLLVSYVFAIFGVGIVRNSIQLSILEQIKDYGNLRCIGSTKSQLKAVVYMQGAILELTGNAIGIVFGLIASLIVGHFVKIQAGFHLVPIVPILIAFLGDLYFAMEENCKVIVNLTPVSAIRGEYRIRKEKIKVRKRSIFGKMFGIEGDYAYKSIMRNPGRFYKTVWALGIGMAAFMGIMSSTGTMNHYVKELADRYGYYHVYFENTFFLADTVNDIQSNLPPADMLESVTNMDGVTDAKRMYSAVVPIDDYEEMFSHYTEDYLQNTDYGSFLNSMHGSLLNRMQEDGGEINGTDSAILASVVCYGYDETDMKRYQSVLIDGTLDVSENGLILVNGGNAHAAYGDDVGLDPGYLDVIYTDYKVGDTIDIVDMARLRAMIAQRLETIRAEYEKELAALPAPTDEVQDNLDTAALREEIEDAYNENKNQAVKECRKQLLEEGVFKTYTIEGIVSKDANHYEGDSMAFVLPLERYYAFTGTDESMVTGMQYHFDKFSARKFNNIVYDGEEVAFGAAENMWTWLSSGYPEMMGLIEGMKGVNRWVMLAVAFVIVMSTFNIVNTTASNMHLRRKEFAQLRVIGISKKRLMKMVMMEGIISSIVAGIIGILLGILFSYMSLGRIFVLLFGANMHFPLATAVIGIVVSALIICGSIYVPLRGLRQDMAADLATGGD